MTSGGTAIGDVDVRVSGRVGPKSWEGQVIHGPYRDVRGLVRTSDERTTFGIGRRQRLIDAGLSWDAEGRTLVVTMMPWSESYELVAHPSPP